MIAFGTDFDDWRTQRPWLALSVVSRRHAAVSSNNYPLFAVHYRIVSNGTEEKCSRNNRSAALAAVSSSTLRCIFKVAANNGTNGRQHKKRGTRNNANHKRDGQNIAHSMQRQVKEEWKPAPRHRCELGLCVCVLVGTTVSAHTTSENNLLSRIFIVAHTCACCALSSFGQFSTITQLIDLN